MGRAYEVRKYSIRKTGAARGKVYTTFAKEIYLVAKKGIPDPDLNVSLKRIIEKAKKSEVPSDIIKRAIDKAKGAGQDEYKEVIYEGFGPGASTLIIKTLTDNVNRTVGEVRAAFNKIHKSLGVTNSVSYNYDNLGIVSFKENDEEKVLNALIEGDVDPVDFETEDGMTTITVKFEDYNKLRDVLDKLNPNYEFELDETGMFAKDKITLDGEDLEKFQLLLELLDKVEDVSEVYHNVELN
jgi:YebC/PmpR family DNA-binding regulatory protein